jgi:hypothetical protein
VNTIQETNICIPISIHYYTISYIPQQQHQQQWKSKQKFVQDQIQVCHVHCAIFTNFHNDCIWACSSSKTQSCLREMAYKCTILKLNYQIVIHKLPLEQNNGNTICTDPIYIWKLHQYKNTTVSKLQYWYKKCMYVPYLIMKSVIQTTVSNYWMGINNELERIKKEETWLNLQYYPGISLERENDKNHAKPKWVQLVPVRIST